MAETSTEVFTKKWVELVNSAVMGSFQGFEWEGDAPKTPLNITYKILWPHAGSKDNIAGSENNTHFSYYLKCSPTKMEVLEGEPADTEVANVIFSQPYDVARGVLEGELNSHIEFLMGRIHIEGDILILGQYRKALELIQSSIGKVSEPLLNP